MSRLVILIYGIVSYVFGVAGLVAIILALSGFLPWGFLSGSEWFASFPLLCNIILVTLWGLIHSVMARASFKAVLTKFIAEAAERPTYILFAGLTSLALVGFWQIVPGQIWLVESSWAAWSLWGLFIFGWTFCLAATFAINHFDLFGLRQVYLHYKQLPTPPQEFVKRAMYQYIRHPIQTGVLIGVWATPSMTATQIILSAGFTAYIFIGLWYEERDLVTVFGDGYLQYRKEAGKLFPKFTK
jgi:protein-S-isoprenylcysteine O-methyltransferase Ste14